MAKATVSEKVKAAVKKATAAVAGPKKSAAAKGAAPKTSAVSKQAKGKSSNAKKAAAQKAAPAKKVQKESSRKSTAKKAAAPKVAARASTVTVKKVARRRTAARTAVPTPAARRARPSAPARKPPRKLKTTAPQAFTAPQTFTVSHLNEADFKADGLRAYAHYRDLGIAAATGGLCQAHVIRLIAPCTDDVRKRHLHKAELQLVYVLKGWMKNEFEGHGEQMMSVGSCWLQPSGIEHTVLDYSPDCEVLEIIVPADFKTEDAT